MSGAALLLTLLTADPQPRAPVAVVVSSKRAGAEFFATKLAAKVHTALSNPQALDDAAASKQLKRPNDPKSCAGATPCLQKAAQALGPHALLIGVDVGKVGKSLAVHLEAVASDATEPLAVADFTAPTDDWNPQSAEPIAAFVKQVADHLAAATPALANREELKKAPDAPTDTNLTPTTPLPGPIVTARQSRGSTPLMPIAAIAVAGAALITSGIFVGLGMSEKSAIDRSITGANSELTQAEFNAHKSKGNLFFTLSLSTLLVGVALGAVAGVLFGTSS